MAKKTGPKAPTKSEIMNNMAEATGHTKKEIVILVFLCSVSAELSNKTPFLNSTIFKVSSLNIPLLIHYYAPSHGTIYIVL